MDAPLQALPATIGVAEFDALHDQPARWQGIVAAIADACGAGPVQPLSAGTALVARAGDEAIVKLYPPFLRDHCDFERALLARLHGVLSLPTPRLIRTGDCDGWPWQLMTRLPGTTLDTVWDRLDEPARLAALRTIGRLAAEVHALPRSVVAEVSALAPPWPDFLRGQRERCAGRQQRTGLPAHLLAQLEDFLDAGPVGAGPAGPDVILTGEYTPFNLMSDGRAVTGMFDFGDGLVGPRQYDWLGPMCFLCAGDAARLDAFFDGLLGRPFDRAWREPLLRLLLLHRYSCLPAQIALPGWQALPDFRALAAAAWP